MEEGNLDVTKLVEERELCTSDGARADHSHSRLVEEIERELCTSDGAGQAGSSSHSHCRCIPTRAK